MRYKAIKLPEKMLRAVQGLGWLGGWLAGGFGFFFFACLFNLLQLSLDFSSGLLSPGFYPVFLFVWFFAWFLCLGWFACLDHLVGLVVRRLPRERKIPGSNPACAGIFSGSSHTSDLKIGTPVAALPGAWRYKVSTGTGRPGVSIL